MKKHTALLLLCFVCFGSGFFFVSKGPFSRKDMAAAQKLLGIQFGKQAVDTMFSYMERNFEGYQAMREFSVDERVVPPLLFKTNYVSNSLQKHSPIDWKAAENVEMGSDDQIAFYSVQKLAALLRSRKITSVELTSLFLKRIKKHDPQLLSVITLLEDHAMEQASKMDAELAAGNYRGILHGIPYGIKDLFAVNGYRTTWGSKPYENQLLNYDATVVDRLEQAGAVLLAKLTSGALARGDVWFGGQTKNPWDLTQGASGSSAGAGAAVSAGLVPFAIGTETLGSIVSPASRCGVTGLRPTYGRVSRYGCMSLSWSMDKAGPLTRNASDAAMVLEAMMGPDGKDLTVEDVFLQHPAAIECKGLRIAYLQGMLEADTTEPGKNAILMIEKLKELGHELFPVSLPSEDSVPYEVFDIVLRAEAGAFFDELVRSGRVDMMEEQDQGSRANSLRQSRFIPAVEYLQANRHRQVLMDKMDELLKNVDVLIAPTFGRQLLITNLTGHPALALPAGFDGQGRPTSITLVGKLFREDVLVALGAEIQEATDYHLQRPKGF